MRAKTRGPSAGPAFGVLRRVLVLGVLLPCSAADAQSAAGSETYTALAQSTTAWGGPASSDGFTAEHGAGQLTTGHLATSAQYSVLSGIVWLEPTLSPGPPVVTSVVPAFGDRDGGAPVTVYGMNFVAPGGNGATVLFGSVPGSGTTVVGNTIIETTAPAGVDACGNPIGATAVGVLNGNGFDVLDGGYTYLPALTQVTPAALAGTLELKLKSLTPSNVLLWTGGGAAGFCLPIPPFDGSNELFLGVQFIGPIAFSTGEQSFSIAIPNDQGLIGKTLPFQGLSIDSFAPLAGSFTNTVQSVIQP